MPRKNASAKLRRINGTSDEVSHPHPVEAAVDPWSYLENHHETIYWSSYVMIGLLLAVTQVIALPVLLQMILYTGPIIYIGAHLSLQQKEIDPVTGERQVKTESMTKHDAMLFPFIGSTALLGLYFAYKFLSAYWVNLLITLYLTFFGCAALGETFTSMAVKLRPGSDRSTWLDTEWTLPGFIARWTSPTLKLQASEARFLSYGLSIIVAISWTVTRHWALHNLFAMAFCIQGIRIVSVGSFKIAVILLSGLFVYDVFWVFGTEVMVSVAKSFEAPAKLIFPVSHNPWRQSILGLGDIVIPGILIAMILRFDYHLNEERLKQLQGSSQTPAADASQSEEEEENQLTAAAPFTIHAHFCKYYFFCNLIAYELGLITTGIVMLVFQHAQPALLYLVPFCLFGLYIPASVAGQLSAVCTYTEELPEDQETGHEKDVRTEQAPEETVASSDSKKDN